jgi:hypothetical protein
VYKCVLSNYPTPEAPGNLNFDNKSGQVTNDYYYGASAWYYLVGEGAKTTIELVKSAATAWVEVDYWEDPLIDQFGGTGIFETAVWGRTDSDGDAYLDSGWMGWYTDDGSDIEKFGSPWAAVTPGADLPLSATSFYDMWPGKADEADNPWESV